MPDHASLRDELLALLEERRKRAEARLRSLTRDFDDIVECSTDASRDDEHDPEGATIAFERAQVTALVAAAEQQLTDIDRAVERLHEGIHDRCEVCEGAIAPERLRARPTARTCVGCASGTG